MSTRTTCPYCGVGCGVLATRAPRGLTIQGDPDHPANFGRLCSKGTALGETVGTKGRLLTPRINGLDAPWDTALDLIATRFRDTIARHGPDSVALYVSGQLLTEDYYVANKLMKGFVGTANIDTNSRLCMASSVAAHRRAFGTDTVPGTYEDLEQADLVVLVGSNLAWCHPVLHQRLLAAKAQRGTQIVVIDPRRTATCEDADLHLPLAPGADAHLFNLLLAHLADHRQTDPAFLRNINSFSATLEAARKSRPQDTGLPPELLERFLTLWSRTEKVVTLWSQGVNQSDTGTDKVNTILNCHLATGRIGKPGMGPFSITGQPNAMGGREVGGMATTLACHLNIEDPAHRAAVQTFWNAPTMARNPGLKAVDLFDAVETGRIKALWILSTNPAVTMPQADRVAQAIKSCPFTVVSDLWPDTDTARAAHILLPATGWGEKDGTVTNSERRISRQRAILPPPGQARPDWWHLAQVAQRMGFQGFDWPSPAAIFREHAALSGIAGTLGSDFDISGLSPITDAEYRDLQPTQWPVTATRTGGRFFADGQFNTPDGRGKMIPVTASLPAPAPFRLNTGRIRDQWHTMTRTGRSPTLSKHLAEPFLDLHPADARDLNLQTADLAQVTANGSTAILRVRVTDAVAPKHPFAPMHWTGQTAPTGRIDALIPGLHDPISGQPALKSAAVRIARFNADWFAFALSATDFRPDTPYWARAPLGTGMQAELAGTEPQDWPAFAARLFGTQSPPAAQLHDAAKGITRLAYAQDGRLAAALFVAPHPVRLSRGHLATLLGQPLDQGTLSGQPGPDRPDPGPTICACLDVGLHTLIDAIASRRALTVTALGAALGAGTNCGSCRPDLAALIARHAPREAAE